ncbi:response regulator transcription factor [Malonomonas rubra]|uniref:response regulator transcription factor n=1 Tax=Malonomonas rubra TaxID=57040 RepID=UPI0026E945DE|nr:response regulator transcription factor [Malonomonas rubra]
MHLLVVEDEKKVALFLKKSLEEEGYKVDLAHDGEEGVLRATSSNYDLIIMDVMMPKKDGLTANREIRGKGITVPILCLTAKDTPEDVVNGLGSGGDDYLTKPFAFAELNARCRALIRRSRQKRGAEIFYADLRLDPVSHKVWRSGNELELSPKEYGLIEYFMLNPEQVLTRSMIAEHVWDYTFDSFTNIIDVYVNYLRKKVDQNYDNKLIRTVRGVGYALREGA